MQRVRRWGLQPLHSARLLQHHGCKLHLHSKGTAGAPIWECEGTATCKKNNPAVVLSSARGRWRMNYEGIEYVVRASLGHNHVLIYYPNAEGNAATFNFD